MEIFDVVMDYLSANTMIRSFGELDQIMEHARNNAPRDWKLPLLACQALGGDLDCAIPGMAAIACLQTAIILVDDVLDSDPRGEYHRIGSGNAANLAIALYGLGLEAVMNCPVAAALKGDVIHSLNHMMLATCQGQQLDVQNPATEKAYWHLVQSKSSPFFGCALRIGAVLGGAGEGLAAQIESFGRLYGELIQVHDDLNDAMEVPANADWKLGRSSLPILFAETVDHPDRQLFIELRSLIPLPYALEQAQRILIRCGAISYIVETLIYKSRLLRQELAAIPLQEPQVLATLIEDLVDPVVKMFQSLSLDPPSDLLKPSN